MTYSYVTGEHRPVEVLIFEMSPLVVEQFLQVDHDIWTMREAFKEGLEVIPFLSKEVWLDDSKPGQVTIVFVWDSLEQWKIVADESFQAQLQSEFDALFPHPITLVSAPHEESEYGIHRVSRFERAGHLSSRVTQ